MRRLMAEFRRRLVVQPFPFFLFSGTTPPKSRRKLVTLLRLGPAFAAASAVAIQSKSAETGEKA